MKKKQGLLTQRTRVRLEFTAFPRPFPQAPGFMVDKKITALRVLLTERLGEDGSKALSDWLIMCALEQQTLEVSRVWVLRRKARHEEAIKRLAKKAGRVDGAEDVSAAGK